MREWDKTNIVKFYDRGKYSYRNIQYTKKGFIKKPRQETQVYLNGKYFIQVPGICNNKGKEVISKVIYILYRYGCDFNEIKRICKLCFYKNRGK